MHGTMLGDCLGKKLFNFILFKALTPSLQAALGLAKIRP